MKKHKKSLFLLLLISGLIFLCSEIFLFFRADRFRRDGINIQAEIVYIDSEYDSNGKEEIAVYVKYSVDNTSYTQKLDYYSSKLYIGEIVPIYYLEDYPTSISYARLRFLPSTLFFIGSVVCLAFSVCVLLNKKKRET